MRPEMRQALNERHELIEQRADALVDQAVHETADWVQPLLPKRQNEDMMTGWRRRARVIAAYRDRHQITSTDPLGRSEEHTSELQSRFDLVCRLLLENKITLSVTT